MPTNDHVRRRRQDACPGAVRLHPAEDGGLARVRVPGGGLAAEQLRAVATAAAELGHDGVELTSRANLQLRGLAGDAGAELARRLTACGLLPSIAHERVRNIIASPLSGCDGNGSLDVRPLVGELDRGLCGDPDLAALPGRFLFVLDDGRGDVAALRADVTVVATGSDAVALLLADTDTGLRAPASAAVDVLLTAARAFLAERRDQDSEAWRLAELDQGPARVAARVRAELATTVHGVQPGAHRPGTPSSGTRGTVGILEGENGRTILGTGAPLGRLSGEQAHVVADTATAGSGEVRLTPWRGVLIPHLSGDPAPLMSTLDDAGLVTDPSSSWIGVTACTGRPGCANARADVRADAARALPLLPTGTRVHWAGCSRRCGLPRGDVIEVVATEDGYDVHRDDQNLSHDGDIADTTAAVAASRRNE